MLVLATAAAISIPSLANSAVIVFNNTLSADQNYSYANVIQPGDMLEYRFSVLEELLIENFSVSATGNNAEADVEDIRFGFVEPLTGLFTTIQSIGTVAAGVGFLDGMTFAVGSVFSVIFDDGITNDVAVTLSFGTETVSPVPLPATGLLLAPFLLAGGIAGWRRRRAAQAAA
jgi:hypothetical protein